MMQGTGTNWEFLDIVGSLKLYDRFHRTRGSQPKYIVQGYVHSLMLDTKSTCRRQSGLAVRRRFGKNQ